MLSLRAQSDIEAAILSAQHAFVEEREQGVLYYRFVEQPEAMKCVPAPSTDR
ncbi:hypothetical protein [Bradyrhizobium sp. AZCC 2230]|uniref:hypothetical protein n=1 Tax=Bradyrhizobium sp. AZCC 2230 TaxID=3117021 RepID=UPI002FEFD4E1